MPSLLFQELENIRYLTSSNCSYFRNFGRKISSPFEAEFLKIVFYDEHVSSVSLNLCISLSFLMQPPLQSTYIYQHYRFPVQITFLTLLGHDKQACVCFEKRMLLCTKACLLFSFRLCLRIDFFLNNKKQL